MHQQLPALTSALQFRFFVWEGRWLAILAEQNLPFRLHDKVVKSRSMKIRAPCQTEQGGHVLQTNKLCSKDCLLSAKSALSTTRWKEQIHLQTSAAAAPGYCHQWVWDMRRNILVCSPNTNGQTATSAQHLWLQTPLHQTTIKNVLYATAAPHGAGHLKQRKHCQRSEAEGEDAFHQLAKWE